MGEPHIWSMVRAVGANVVRLERAYGDEERWKQIKVRLETEEDAAACIRKLDGTAMGKEALAVAGCPQIAAQPQNVRDQVHWVRASNLKRGVREQDLLSHIQQNGRIAHRPRCILLSANAVHTKWPSFALIECVTVEDATLLVQHLNLSTLHGAKMWVQWETVPPFQRNEHLKGRTKTVRFEHLHHSVTEDRLRTMCSEYGAVHRVTVPTMNGYPRCVGVVEMTNAVDAEIVYDAMHLVLCETLRMKTCFDGEGAVGTIEDNESGDGLAVRTENGRSLKRDPKQNPKKRNRSAPKKINRWKVGQLAADKKHGGARKLANGSHKKRIRKQAANRMAYGPKTE